MKALLKLTFCGLIAGLFGVTGCGGEEVGDQTGTGGPQIATDAQSVGDVETGAQGLIDSADDHGCAGTPWDFYYDNYEYYHTGLWQCTAWMGTHWYTEQRIGLYDAGEAALEECRRYQWYERCYVGCCEPLF